MGVFDDNMSYFSLKLYTICCDPSSALSRRDGSDEGSYMILCRMDKNHP